VVPIGPDPPSRPRITSAPPPRHAPSPRALPTDRTAQAPEHGDCQICGVRGPTHYVELKQNVGLIVLRLTKAVKGNLCERCAADQFRATTIVTAFFGWWGIVSFFATPIILIGNVSQYLGARQAFRAGASRPLRSAAAPSTGTIPLAAGDAQAPAIPPDHGLAIASLAVAGFGMCLSIGGVVPLIAVAIGFVALQRVSRDPQRYAGRGVALAGIIIGGIGVLINVAMWTLAFFWTR
jgi:hypothetical protein